MGYEAKAFCYYPLCLLSCHVQQTLSWDSISTAVVPIISVLTCVSFVNYSLVNCSLVNGSLVCTLSTSLVPTYIKHLVFLVGSLCVASLNMDDIIYHMTSFFSYACAESISEQADVVMCQSQLMPGAL